MAKSIRNKADRYKRNQKRQFIGSMTINGGDVTISEYIETINRYEDAAEESAIHTVPCKMSKQQAEQLKQIAESENTTVSDLMREGVHLLILMRPFQVKLAAYYMEVRKILEALP